MCVYTDVYDLSLAILLGQTGYLLIFWGINPWINYK